ncbi:sensor domain-containing protein [Chloroflexota bacterium]
MVNSIEEYLRQLKKELAGCDRATIQDALSDAEEYLRTALNSAIKSQPGVSEADALPPIIEKYGLPADVATAYREIERRIVPALDQPSYPEESEEPKKEKDERPLLSRFFGVFADFRAWGAFLYLLFSLLTGILYFTWAVTGISLSAGLIILIIGLPFTGLFILSVRGIGLVEGRIIEALLGIRMPRRPQFHRRNMGLWSYFKNIVLDKYTWLSIAYMILQLPLGTIYFSVFITLIALSLSGIAMPILQLGFDVPVNINGGSYYLAGWMLPLAVVAGILLATLTMHLAKYVGHMHGALAKTLLVRS